MVPIIGADSNASIAFGFDLCESCHYSEFDLTGHANQEHVSNQRLVWNNRSRRGVMKRTQISQTLSSAREAEMAQDELGHAQKKHENLNFNSASASQCLRMGVLSKTLHLGIWWCTRKPRMWIRPENRRLL